MRTSWLPAVVVAGLCVPTAAGAAGFPIAGVDTTKQGATTPGSDFRYVAFPGRNSTVVAKIWRNNGSPQRYRRIPGDLVVVPVAQDAATTGLSADGSTLVLGTPRRRFPAPATRLEIVNTDRLTPVATVRLRGDFALDGVSPDGRRLFLIQYRHGSPTDYAVRAYDVAHMRLVPKPIVDPRNPDEKMTGFPLTRTVSRDGRWAYTLYASDEPFVHALDTARGRAFCVDLPGLTADALSELRLVARHRRVDLVTPSGGVLRHIDATTFRVSTPRFAAAPAKNDAPSDGFPWGLAAAVAAIAAAALFVLRRRYAAGTDASSSSAASSSSPTVP